MLPFVFVCTLYMYVEKGTTVNTKDTCFPKLSSASENYLVFLIRITIVHRSLIYLAQTAKIKMSSSWKMSVA